MFIWKLSGQGRPEEAGGGWERPGGGWGTDPGNLLHSPALSHKSVPSSSLSSVCPFPPASFCFPCLSSLGSTFLSTDSLSLRSICLSNTFPVNSIFCPLSFHSLPPSLDLYSVCISIPPLCFDGKGDVCWMVWRGRGGGITCKSSLALGHSAWPQDELALGVWREALVQQQPPLDLWRSPCVLPTSVPDVTHLDANRELVA